jgi:uncharacterized membrane protein
MLKHIRSTILKGFFTAIPLGLTILVIRFFYVGIDRFIVDRMSFLPKYVPGLGIVLLVIMFYVFGLFVLNVLGKRLLDLFETLVSKIPLINTTYNIGKQLSSTLTLSERKIFKKVVLIDYLSTDSYAIGFVTGEILAEDKLFYKVFVPTPPNPATGFIVIVEQSKAKEPGWTIEEGIKTVVSVGLIGPGSMKIPK